MGGNGDDMRRFSFCLNLISGLMFCGGGAACIVLGVALAGAFSPSYSQETLDRNGLAGTLLMLGGVDLGLVGWMLIRTTMKEAKKGV
jgi:hypothetical protein